MAEERKPVEVSRRIEAPATRMFKILANPHRHVDFDGSGMLRGAVLDRPISNVGDTFTMKMHRLGDDYLMLNYVVEFEPDRRIFWEPAPGDASRAEDNDPFKVGIPAGYRWGYTLDPDGDNADVFGSVRWNFPSAVRTSWSTTRTRRLARSRFFRCNPISSPQRIPESTAR